MLKLSKKKINCVDLTYHFNNKNIHQEMFNSLDNAISWSNNG